MESSPLTSIHQTQHLVLFKLFAEQELLDPSPRQGEGPTAGLELCPDSGSQTVAAASL